MGQIVSSAAKPKRCNLNQLSQVPTPAAGEHILVSSDNSMNAAGQGNFDCYIVGDGTKAATELSLRTIGSDTIEFNGKDDVTSGAVFDFGTLQDQIAYAKAEGLVVNGAGKILGGLSATYWISYVVAQEDTTIGLEFTRNTSYQYDGKIFILDDASLLVAGTIVVPLYQVALNETYSNAYTIRAGQCLCVEAFMSDVCVFTQIKTLKQKVAEIEDFATKTYNALNIYPKEGVNLVRLADIQAGKIVNGTSGEILNNGQGWRAIEIDIIPKTRIFMNLIFSGYFSFVDKNGAVIQVDANTYNLGWGYIVPDGAVKARFSINSSVADGDITSYAYISYGRPLMQDEIENRVGYDGSFTYEKILRPTDYEGLDIAAFGKVLCIGDSITEGYFNTNGNIPYSQPLLAYPQNLQRITGCEVTNLGDSGESTASWWAAHQNDAELTGAKCVIIELGINDDASTLDTTTKTAMDSIISKLKSENKKVKIFLSGIPSGKSYPARLSTNAYYTKDQWLKNYYNTYFADDEQVYFLDIARYTHICEKYNRTSNYEDFNQGHLSAYGYWRLAKDYANYISYIMSKSETSFYDIQFIGTDFDFTH